MITRSSAGLSALLLSAALLVGCSETSGSDQIMSIPESVQVQAHATCQAEQGIQGVASVEVLELGDGRVVASTLDGGGVSLNQARSINQCAQAKLLGRKTTVAPQSIQPVVAAPVHQQAPLNDGLSGCVKGGGVLQGGLRICPGY